MTRSSRANQPAAGKAGLAFQLTVEGHCPGLPEPERLAKTEIHHHIQHEIRA